MIFQTFDDKNQCVLFYEEGDFHEALGENSTHTWSYVPYLKEKENILYAQLFVEGQNLEKYLSPASLHEWHGLQHQMKACFVATGKVGLKIDEHCLYDLLPPHLLKKWAEIKNEGCEKVFATHKQPLNYDHLLKINKMVSHIKEQPLNLDLSQLIRITVQDKNIYKLITENPPYIKYNMFNTITGRLSTARGSFPVMTLAKKYRNILIPNNDWLFEMDYNACELRVALALLSQEQPDEDLHEWNLENVFQRAKSRDNAKKRIFSWLYNPNSKDEAISKVYDREKLKTLYYRDNKVYTPFGRQIECEEYYAVNYLIQSTAADLVFEQMYKVWEYLQHPQRKSFIKFCNHDSVMIDLHREQEYEFNEIKELFSNTRFGKFKVNCLGGKNWAEMKDLYIK